MARPPAHQRPRHRRPRRSTDQRTRARRVAQHHGVSHQHVSRLARWPRPWRSRPHPPYTAAGKWANAYDPATVDMPIAPAAERHGFHEAVMQLPDTAAPRTEAGMRRMRAQYYGMIGEVDHHLGRIVATLRERGEWNNTVIVISADHGEQLGDHGLREKVGYFEQSYHIIGMVRSPQHRAGHGRVVQAFTEN
ncbi:MAG: hypothetical protein EBX18_01375, partial [Actinobacteria bacterium]|nr:hypothetical protein [Actinomycetota bacterium]